jgi:hypothetical protein
MDKSTSDALAICFFHMYEEGFWAKWDDAWLIHGVHGIKVGYVCQFCGEFAEEMIDMKHHHNCVFDAVLDEFGMADNQPGGEDD